VSKYCKISKVNDDKYRNNWECYEKVKSWLSSKITED
jgi:hypothetical protein